MRIVRAVGMIMFIVGAIIAILDLLNVILLQSIDNPFYGALILMILGISLTFFTQAKEQ